MKRPLPLIITEGRKKSDHYFFSETINFGNLLAIVTALCLTILCGSDLKAQVAVAGSTGADGAYTTLKGAFDAINANAAQAGNNISIVISASTTETASASLNQPTTSSWNTLTITCTVPVTVSGSIVGAVIKLNGADNVTIDGRIAGSGRNLTIANTSTATATAAVWLSSLGVGLGATGNTIRNCEIACGATQNTSTNTTFGIIMCGTTISTTANGDDNDNNSFIDNRIIRCRIGICTRGVTTNNNQNIMVSDNLIGPASFGADEIGLNGILMQADNLSTVTRNTVQFVGGNFANTTSGSDRIGIAIGTAAWSSTATTTITSANYTITRNLVHDIIEERTFSAVGILVGTTQSGPPTNNLICSNMIYNVRANGTGGDQAAGIGHVGHRADKIVYNSILMTGDLDPAAAATATSNPVAVGIAIHSSSTADTAITVKDNIMYLDLNSNTTTLLKSCMVAPAVGYLWGTGGSNYNDYWLPNFLNGNVTGVAGTGTVSFSTLANWQTAYTPAQDGSSIQADPGFISSSDLHIMPSSTSVSNNGTPVSCTIDFDNEARSGTPDIGADEYTSVGLPPDDAGVTAIILPNPLCPGIGIVQATIKNFGSATLNSVLVDWTVTPGGAQPQVNPVISLASGASTNITLGNFTFAAGTTYSIMAVTSMPNGMADGNTANDAFTQGSIQTGLTGTYTVGVGGDYTTLTAAAAAFNTRSLCSPVVFSLTDANYPSETYPITFNNNASSSNTNTLTIKPTQASTTFSGSSASGLIVLNGADYVTLDGSTSNTTNSICPMVSASRNLTLTNTSTSTSSVVVGLFSLGAGAGATNNVVKNLNLVGTTLTATNGTLCGVYSGGTTISNSSLGIDNDNNTIQNNNITKTQYGIYSSGESAANKNSGTVISQNVMNAIAPNNLNTGGIFMRFDDGAQINKNDITVIRHDGTSGQTVTAFGIALGVVPNNTSSTFTGSDVTNATVSKNKINGIVQLHSTGYSAFGIVVNTVTSGTTLVANNMINGVIAASTASDFSAGIVAGGGTGSTTNIYYNTVSMTGARGAATYPSYALAIGGTIPVIDNRNNILLNTQTSTGAGQSYAIGLAYISTVGNYANLTSNNNDLFTSGSSAAFSKVGGLAQGSGTNKTSLVAWQTETGRDGASVSMQPVFISATDLHVDGTNPANYPLNNGAVTIGVTDDIDCDSRATDIGADEFAFTACNGAVGGMATVVGSSIICSGQSATINATGYSTGNGSTYEWEQSNDNFVVNIVGTGQTNPATFNTGPLTSTTYYRLRVQCASNSSTAYSNIVTITINLPAVTCPSPFSLCLDTPPFTLTGGTPIGGTYTGPGVSSNSFNAGVAGVGVHVITYTITDMSGCTNSCTFNITVTPSSACASSMTWVLLPAGGSCSSTTNCCNDILCYGLQYTPGVTGTLTSYTTGFFINCVGGSNPVVSNMSCVMDDNSEEADSCTNFNLVLFNSSGFNGTVPVTQGVPIILHKICLYIPEGETLTISEDDLTNLSASVDLPFGAFTDQFPDYEDVEIMREGPEQPDPGSDLVECAGDAVAPELPIVLDMCGSPIEGELVSISDEEDPIVCEGTRIYTYSFTDCSDYSVSWTFTYTIDRTTPPSEMDGPASTSDMVVGIDNAVPPTLPMVKDVCGVSLTAVLDDVVDDPDPIVCNGTRTYYYSFTDCSGLSFLWNFTYTIDNVPVMSCPDDFEVCYNDAPFALTGATPLNGVYSGDGVSMTGVFSPASAGTGMHLITYTFTNAQGCSNFCTFTITVKPSPVVTCRPSAAVCIDEDPFLITGENPTGGTYTGDGVMPGNMFDPGMAGLGFHVITYSYTAPNGCNGTCSFVFNVTNCPGDPEIKIIPLDPCETESNGTCVNQTNCCENILCFAIEYTPGYSGDLTTYTTGFFTDCVLMGVMPVTYNQSCVMTDNSFEIDECDDFNMVLFNSSGYSGMVPITAGIPVIIHQVCLLVPPDVTLNIVEDEITDLTASIDLTGGGFVTEYPTYIPASIARTDPVLPADGTDIVACLNEVMVPDPPLGYSQCCEEIEGVLTSVVDDPDPLTCEGTRIYTYTYEDCGGATNTWNFTYTIEYEPFDDPMDDGSTVICSEDADIAPTSLPLVVDNCDNILMPSGPVVSPPAGCGGTRTYTYTYMDCEGNTQDWVYTYTIDCDSVIINVFLEGPYNSGTQLMNTNLNYLHILPGQDPDSSADFFAQIFGVTTPPGQPYFLPPFNYNGTEGDNYGDDPGDIHYAPDIVDWILVSVRANDSLPESEVWKCAALLHNDSEVEFPAGCPCLQTMEGTDYYIVVEHRNHLPIMSTEIQALNGNLSFDFTQNQSWIYLFLNTFPFGDGQKLIGSNYVMYSGNSEQIFSRADINATDDNQWNTENGSFIIYRRADHNMNGEVTATDEFHWLVNNGRLTFLPF